MGLIPIPVRVFFLSLCGHISISKANALIDVVALYPLIDYSTNENGHVAGEELSLVSSYVRPKIELRKL